MRRQRKKRKFNLFSAIFLEIASILGIIAIAQPNLIVEWFVAGQILTMQSNLPEESASRGSSSVNSTFDPNQSKERLSDHSGSDRATVAASETDPNKSQRPNRSSADRAYQYYLPPGVYPNPIPQSPSKPRSNLSRRVPAELVSHQRRSPPISDRTPKTEKLAFPSLADLRGYETVPRFEQNYQRLPIFP